jgi:hypothetical protein
VLRIRAVGKKSEHTLITVSSQRVKIEQLSINRRGVDFEIAGMNDRACGCFYSESKRVHD